jgi:Ca2+-binding EF-hand superfamily protein
MDEDEDSSTLCFKEFTKFLKMFDQDLSYKDQRILFSFFDADNSELISLEEFKY